MKENEEEERGLKSPKRGPSVNSDNEHEQIIMDVENLSLGGGNEDDAEGGDGGPIKTSSLHTVASDAPMKIDAVAAADVEATTNKPTTKLASDAAVGVADAAIIAGGNGNDNKDAAAAAGSSTRLVLDRLDSAPTIPTATESKHKTSTTTTTTGGTRPPSSQPPPPPSSIPSPSSSSSDYNAAALDIDNDDCPDVHDTLLTMSYNQDGGCLAVGTGSGFRICNIFPFQETFRRSLGGSRENGDEDATSAMRPNQSSFSSSNNSSSSTAAGGGGIAKIEMLYRTNLLALTGHATSTLYPPNKVYLYDDHLQRPIGELSFRQRVLTTKLRRDRIVVVLRDRVYVYNFSDLSLLDKVHTGDNALGLIGISTDHGGVGGFTATIMNANNNAPVGGSDNNGMVLACPGTQRGQVRIELYGLRRTTFVDAHDSALGALALSVDGCLLATASERGTVIRLFDTRGVTIGGGNAGSSSSGSSSGGAATVSSSTPLREFRRGVDRATISCLTFSLDSAWLGCASDHGTVHVFQTHDPTTTTTAINGSVSNIDGGGSSACVEGTKKSRSSMTGKAMMLLPKLLSSSPSSYLIEGTKAYAQVRGVPHPKACAFIPDREQTISVAGLDDFGNGCILLAEFGPKLYNTIGGDGDGKRRSVTGGGDQSKVSTTMEDSTEARRLGYHRFFKCKSPASQTGRRPRSKKKDSNNNTIADDVLDGGAYIDDTPVDMRMNHISIGDENEDDFVPIEYK